ncbi:S-layer protein PS2 [Corynebacterium glutamicum]|uniref:S-layer protein PS2 n=1 Tax=Corynebacterium glutamicum TaxID=1718 RepID=UPI003B59669C
MFNNRIRTAALAGAIAISTAASGVAIPAFAQETNPTFNITNGFNDADGSTAQPVGPVNHTEETLRDLTDSTGAYLEEFQYGNVEEIVEAYLQVQASADGFDPSEQAAYEAFEAARVRASQELAASAETITKTRESVNYALKVDREATAAFEAYRSALNDAAVEINPLIAAANTANATDETIIEKYDALYAIDLDLPAPELKPAYDELLALQAEVNEDIEWLGEWAIDHEYNDYVTRDHVKAVQALKAAIDAQVEAIAPIRQDAIDKNLLAQESDVLVRQLFLERATAQRDTLRVVEAIFSTSARYVELYENVENVNVENKTLRQHYSSLIPNLFIAAVGNINELNNADEAASELFLDWDTDLTTNDEDEAYYQAKLDFAIETYAKILINGEVWQEPLAYVQNLDAGARQEAADREAARAADEAYRAEQLRIAQEAADAQKAIADALAKEAENGNNSSDDKETGSSDIGSWGPFAAIAAIIAAIAAIFPFLSGIVKF